MESDYRFYTRRAAEERRAALRSITAEARERHDILYREFAAKAQACEPVALSA